MAELKYQSGAHATADYVSRSNAHDRRRNAALCRAVPAVVEAMQEHDA